ncbi:VIT and VWA domain-containing protein [Aliikangiella sp. G2MR2-5]|uniref:VIT and vWA domain-containing protein n=1 Tax=Aliikangiella sp. G2MR2-5 TaxID=2788943 RepID=UPI0018AAF95A|nr:VIT and VWA domain-containing protein [Aliikangiella sp. G2MR2-5]
MKSFNRFLIIFSTFIISMASQAAGLLTPKDSSSSLELKEHHVNVVVENGYAMTEVTQIFHNDKGADQEAIYSFPVPENGAVGEFSVWIDDKQVTGEVVEKEKARQIYEQEKANGNHAGLTEQKEYKTFETSVYPVRANQDTKIQLRYYQPAEIDLGVGRWIYQLEDGGVDEEALAFWDTNTRVTKAFSLSFLLRSGYPVEAVRLPNHPQAQITQLNANEWKVSIRKSGNNSAKSQANNDKVSDELATTYAEANIDQLNKNQIDVLAESNLSSQATAPEAFRLDQDLVVYWKLKAGLPGSIDLLTYRPDPSKKGTFMMTFTPGDDLEKITRGSDWVFVLDISGSMTGKFSSLSEGVSRSLQKMRAEDRFRIILFNDNAQELTSGYENASRENISHYLSKLSQVSPDKGTNLYAGIEQGLSSLNSDRPTAIVLVTDGVANIGNTKKEAFFKLLEKHDVRLFTFIMGNSANTPLLEPLARRSGGFALSVSNADDIIGRVMLASQRLTHKAYHDVEVNVDGVKVSDFTPEYIGNLYRGQQLVIMGHYWKSGPAKVELKAKLSGQPKSYSTNIEFPGQTVQNPELERLWAFAKIKDLDERMSDFEDQDHKNAIKEIALEYGLVTDYTSMLVLREEQFQSYNIDRINKVRVEREQNARQVRSTQPVKNNRADKSQPAFQHSRPSFGGGGGSFGWGIGFLSLLVLFTREKKK